MGDVVKWNVPINDNMSVTQFKKLVVDMDFTQAVLLTYYEDGSVAINSTGMCKKDALWIIEQAKSKIL